MSKLWWKAAGIRAIKTFAQTAGSLILVGATLAEIDWLNLLSAATVAAILSFFTSIAGLPEIEYEQKAKDNEDCYIKMLNENNILRDELYSGEDSLNPEEYV